MMKRDAWYSLLVAAVLAFCIGFGSIACVVTGLGLDVTDGSPSASFYTLPVDMAEIIAFCALFSMVAAAAFSLRRGEWFLLGGLALILGYLWRRGTLETSVEAALYRITYIYDRAYHFGVAKWTGADPAEASANMGFCILAGIPVLATAWTVCRRKNSFFAVLGGGVLLGLCMVVTDTVPQIWCLVLLLTGLTLLVLTNTVRRRCASEGNRLTALLLVPAVLYVSLLCAAVPQKGYTSKINALTEAVAAWLQNLPVGDLIPVNVTGNTIGAMNLTAVGPKNDFHYAVMDVRAAKDGILYLRGQSLDVYNGTSWSASTASTGLDGGWPRENWTTVGQVAISVRRGLPIQYFPYYPRGESMPGGISLKNGGLENPERQDNYTFVQMEPLGSETVSLSQNLETQCLHLPQDTEKQAANYLQKLNILPGSTNAEIAQIIGSYVSQTARYDLNTEKMPVWEKDFALWFLRSGDSGYCVHFASAAVVLLRAAGVPARYVSGYAVKVKAGETITVGENRAHAWAEYFDPGWGWKVLDATPSDWYVEEEETTPPTQATEPGTEPTEPPEPTQPSSAEEEPDPTEATQNTTAPGEEPKPEADLRWVLQVLKWLGIILGIFLALSGQYLLRRRLRNKQMHTGHPNQRALARWKAVVRISRILKEAPPEELYALAEKAKFSQHTLTIGERMAFDRHLDQAEEKLKEMNAFKRWCIRLIFAV